VKEILLGKYLKEEQTGDNARIEEHLKNCWECRDFMNYNNELNKLTERFREIAPSKGVWQNVRERLEMEENSGFRIFYSRRLFWWLAIPSAVILLILSVIFLKEPSQNQIAEFIGNQAELMISLDAGDATIYEPLDENGI